MLRLKVGNNSLNKYKISAHGQWGSIKISHICTHICGTFSPHVCICISSTELIGDLWHSPQKPLNTNEPKIANRSTQRLMVMWWMQCGWWNVNFRCRVIQCDIGIPTTNTCRCIYMSQCANKPIRGRQWNKNIKNKMVTSGKWWKI